MLCPEIFKVSDDEYHMQWRRHLFMLTLIGLRPSANGCLLSNFDPEALPSCAGRIEVPLLVTALLGLEDSISTLDFQENWGGTTVTFMVRHVECADKVMKQGCNTHSVQLLPILRAKVGIRALRCSL